MIFWRNTVKVTHSKWVLYWREKTRTKLPSILLNNAKESRVICVKTMISYRRDNETPYKGCGVPCRPYQRPLPEPTLEESGPRRTVCVSGVRWIGDPNRHRGLDLGSRPDKGNVVVAPNQDHKHNQSYRYEKIPLFSWRFRVARLCDFWISR